VRGTVTLTAVTDVPGGVQAERTVTITAEGADKPACVAEHLVRYLA
jgi:acyl dehydratase